MLNHTSRTILPALLAATLLACGCATTRVADLAVSGSDLVVLLPDADTGLVGRALVSNAAGSVELAAARDTTRVTAGETPTTVEALSDAEVSRLFGSALSALPPPPLHFTLNFRFESDALTDEALALLPTILQSVRERAAPDVLVVGHTDTTGPAATNLVLGLRRATAVRDLLVTAGLDASLIEVISNGERDPLVPTDDETAEPRNRRVEIAVR